ncbi:MAG: right-handed parallel beta-helix repeat-containing protein [Oligosphaeraceae bacterium]
MTLTIPCLPDETDAAPRLNRLLQALPPDSHAILEPGVYRIRQPLVLQNLHHVTLNAYDAILEAHHDTCRLYEDSHSTDAIHIANASALTLAGLTIRSSQPIGVLATVLETAPDGATLRLAPTHPLSGHEVFIHGSVLLDDGIPSSCHLSHRSPDPAQRAFIGGEIVTTSPRMDAIPCEWLDRQTIRLTELAGLQNLAPGKRLLLCHSYYGPSACVCRNASDLTFQDLTITRFGGMAFVFLPRCHNATFHHLTIAPADDLPVALAADGIHTTGLAGKLTLANATFIGLRDDALNAHTQFLTVKHLDGNRAHLHYHKLHGRISPHWAQPGDRLRVCSPDSCQHRADVIVTSFTPITPDDGSGDTEAVITVTPDHLLQPGDLLANDAYFPELDIHDCLFRTYRRTLVIQATNRCTVRDCRFERSPMAVYISGNYGLYLEAGMVANALICNNTFDHSPSGKNIFIRMGGPGTLGPAKTTPDIAGDARHLHLTLAGNRFLDCNPDRPHIVANATDHLTIQNNDFLHSGTDPIAISHCTHVTCHHNSIRP